MPTTSRITFQEYAIQPFKKLDIPSKVAEFGKKFPWKALGYTAALGVTVPVTGATCLALVAIYPLGIAGAAPIGGLVSAFLVYKICTSLFSKKGNDKQPDYTPTILPHRAPQNNKNQQPDIIPTPSNTPAATASTQRNTPPQKALSENLRTSIQNRRPSLVEKTQDHDKQDIPQPGENYLEDTLKETNEPKFNIGTTLWNRIKALRRTDSFKTVEENAEAFKREHGESSGDDGESSGDDWGD